MAALDSQVRQLMRKHRLAQVRVTCSQDRVVAEALPDRHHPIVEERRLAAFAGAGSISMNEAAAIHERATREPVATFTSTEIELAIQGLKKELQR